MIVIVGAGPTGVELAGALAELRSTALPVMYAELDLDRVRIVLVEMTEHVLGQFSPKLRRYAADELRQRGVDVRLGTAVTEVRADGVVLTDGELVPSAATVWSSGVKVPDEVAAWGFPQGRGGRILVGADLRVMGEDRVFAVGDVAASEGSPLPQLAQPAIQGGRHAGSQVRRLLEGQPTQPFVYHDRGTMATIGRNDAVLQLPNGVTMRGRPAWLLWVAVHVAGPVGPRNRVATLANLAVRYLAWPGGLNLIVGDPPPVPGT